MDIITTKDTSVSTDLFTEKTKEVSSLEKFKKSRSSVDGLKIEKKKSESKKLKKKLIEIKEENESMTKLIQDKNAEILELRKSVNSLNEVLNSVPIEELRCNSSIASAKLLDLSKKNRSLKSELEKTKNRLSQKEQQLYKLEKDIERSKEKDSENRKNKIQVPFEELVGKLASLQQKLFETRNKNLELTSQLKLAQKCLQQEIGDNFNINHFAAHASTTNWRGRAQQILNLQQKVKELQERLENQEQNNLGNEHLLHSTSSLGFIDRPGIRKNEIQHRAKVESLEKVIVDLKNDLEDQKSKILALKVRNKTLNDELVQYKMKSSALEQQSDFITINVAIMNDRLNEQKLSYEKKLEELKKEKEAHFKDCKEYELHAKNLKECLEEQNENLKKKDETIEHLEMLVSKLEQDLKALCGGFLFSCREFRKEEFITLLDTLETEKNSLLDHNKTLNERVNGERHRNDELLEQISKQKIRISRLEAKVRDLERELDVQTEKKKRTQRIADFTANISNKGSNASLSTLTFDNASLAGNRAAANEVNQNELSDIKNRLELTTEKLQILKEKLDYITTEKENDIKTFHEIITNSKNMILETVLANRNSHSSVQMV